MATESQLDACDALRKKIALVMLEAGDESVAMATLSQILLEALYAVSNGDYNVMRKRLMGLVDVMERTVK